ncbi:hypothetical protein HETIRDRAFT_322375 [Heterobasidion irregulare TC 32-1]|uniref:C2H2-type domain-containing protein n=1 Tax=Heterobasidion irregulare (strain TC 32-1) TaxID=747525 RepID=W4K279_HETIT|nr:uncharacterized protein HETIRDRAFT_322375 [Heterobasidion irregulare TC 32-1]ETW79455.1 hypothetical protein HETIRDRAFT_322375 [Heterobasidion irregulare TC 32-1]
MEYAHYPSYSPRDWQDAMYTDANVDPASYPLLAVGYPAQQNMAAQYQHEPMYTAVEPEWAPTSSQLQFGHAMAGPSYVASGDVYFPQQMLPVGGMYYQAAPIAYGPTYVQEGLTRPYRLPYIVQPNYGAVQMSRQPVPISRALCMATGSRTGVRYAPYEQGPMPAAARSEGAVVGEAGTHEGFEGYTLSQTTNTSRLSDRRNDTANGQSPEAVQSSGGGRTRRQATMRAPKMDERQTPYLSTEWNCHDCQRGYGREYELKRHCSTTRSHVEASLKCDQCKNSGTFSRPDALLTHKRAFHGWP